MRGRAAIAGGSLSRGPGRAAFPRPRPVPTPRSTLNGDVKRLVLMSAALGVLVLAAAVAVVANTAGSQGSPRGLVGPLMPPGLRAAGFTLRDQSGRPVSLSQYRGRVVVLAFMHSLCTGSCPIIAQQIRGAIADLGGRAREVQVLALSIEPVEDTPASVDRFLARQHVQSIMRYLIGPVPELRRMWKAYAIQPSTPGHRHSTFTFLIDRGGVERVGYPLDGLTPENLSHDIGVLLSERTPA